MTDFVDTDVAIGTIKQLKRQVLKSKENLNDILKLREYTKSKFDDSVRFVALKALETIFTKFLINGDFKATDDPEEPVAKKQKTQEEMLEKVRGWLRSQFESVVGSFLDMVEDPEPGIQIPALRALLIFERHIGAQKKSPHFSNVVFPRAITRLAVGKNFTENVLEELTTEFVNPYHDVRINLLITLKNIVTEVLLGSSKSNRQLMCENIFLLLRTVKIPNVGENTQYQWDYLVPVDVNSNGETEKDNKQDKVGAKRKRASTAKKPATKKNKHVISIGKFKRAFQECWTSFLGINFLPDHVLCTVLRTLHIDLLPNFAEPILLMDFLSDTYDKAEATMKTEEGKEGEQTKVAERAKQEEKSLLALNGLFYLIINHNLDYPSFFPKLYRMLTTNIIQSPHSAQFFKLVCAFLKTPLIPGYMVLAFLKRLGRLMLLAPAPVASLILPIIYNSMIYHPTAQSLVHNIRKVDAKITSNLPELQQKALQAAATSPLDLCGKPLARDPFIFEEMDMKLCKADESSLWELYAINNYYVPSLKGVSKTFCNNFSAKNMFLLSELEAYSYESQFEKEMKSKKVKPGVPLAYKEPTVLVSDELYPGWQ